MKRDRLLWVDDEISLLRPHILFLEGKGYEVDTVTNGQDALDRCRATTYDLIFLDENMPGLSGLQTLALIKEICPTVPIIISPRVKKRISWTWLSDKRLRIT